MRWLWMALLLSGCAAGREHLTIGVEFNPKTQDVAVKATLEGP